MSNLGVTDPPVTDVDYEDLGMTEMLIVELLAARHRLGESRLSDAGRLVLLSARD